MCAYILCVILLCTVAVILCFTYCNSGCDGDRSVVHYSLCAALLLSIMSGGPPAGDELERGGENHRVLDNIRLLKSEPISISLPLLFFSFLRTYLVIFLIIRLPVQF